MALIKRMPSRRRRVRRDILRAKRSQPKRPRPPAPGGTEEGWGHDTWSMTHRVWWGAWQKTFPRSVGRFGARLNYDKQRHSWRWRVSGDNGTRHWDLVEVGETHFEGVAVDKVMASPAEWDLHVGRLVAAREAAKEEILLVVARAETSIRRKAMATVDWG